MSDPQFAYGPKLADIRLRRDDSALAWDELMSDVGGRNDLWLLVLNGAIAVATGVGGWWYFPLDARRFEWLSPALFLACGFELSVVITGIKAWTIRSRSLKIIWE